METILKTAQSTVKRWWISLILGVLFIVMGIWIFRTPLESFITLSIIFSMIILFSGIFGIIFSIAERKDLKGWGWYLTGGILDLVIGLLLVSHPVMTMAILPLYIGFWLLFQGIFSVGFSFQLNSYNVPNWGWLLFFGILTVLFAILLLANPIIASLSIVYMASFAFVFAGIFRVMLAFDLKRIHKRIKDY